ncbi:MAG: hypothetical protein M4579_007233 [Chaenotheca gracillima]|nr:MAG: hypothetical protein M4579_007233 [Chaenotheca gracillima]
MTAEPARICLRDADSGQSYSISSSHQGVVDAIVADLLAGNFGKSKPPLVEKCLSSHTTTRPPPCRNPVAAHTVGSGINVLSQGNHFLRELIQLLFSLIAFIVLLAVACCLLVLVVAGFFQFFKMVQGRYQAEMKRIQDEKQLAIEKRAARRKLTEDGKETT